MKISWTDHEQSEVLHTDKDKRNILCTTEGRKANWTGHLLRSNYFQQHVSEGKLEWLGIRARRRKHLLGGIKKTRR